MDCWVIAPVAARAVLNTTSKSPVVTFYSHFEPGIHLSYGCFWNEKIISINPFVSHSSSGTLFFADNSMTMFSPVMLQKKLFCKVDYINYHLSFAFILECDS